MTSINRAFLQITCAAATMTAILLVSSGDALASKANRLPDTGGEVIRSGKSTPVVKRKITRNPSRGGQVVERKIRDTSDCKRVCK
jgi:hypothetical protein